MPRTHRRSVGQIAGKDRQGNLITIWVDREGDLIVLSQLSAHGLKKHAMPCTRSPEAEAVRIFDLKEAKFTKAS